MAKYVREIVNPEMFFLGRRAAIAVARGCILRLGISAVPVLDENGVPQGVLSLRDIADGEEGFVEAHMSTPAIIISESATIEEAGEKLAETGLHRLVAVDGDGRAVGMVSALDVIKGLLGKAVRFPEKFKHRDKSTGLVWLGDYDLAEGPAKEAPAEPGLIVLKYGVHGVPDVPIWVGMTDNLRDTLLTMVVDPRAIDPLLAHWTTEKLAEFRFRMAVVEEPDKRRDALDALRGNSRVRAWARDIGNA